MTIYALHRTIQIAFGWENYHLHAFTARRGQASATVTRRGAR
ncbi:hypothetical protein ACFSQT_01305 [Mesorhizobium calcicola]|uniref:Plasmid pRiA4b Orf3-like domain-containing protein n=1 Tax=Mesorhizobium calcicola TaxID=1300310 RepID=A0ABW4W931_9HYPH